jgi:hypothetical protein
MDILKMIQHLLDERKRIDATIARLEALNLPGTSGSTSASVSGKRRGRKNMSLTEREEVSRRMRNYWETRRREAAERKVEKKVEEKAAGHAAGSGE